MTKNRIAYLKRLLPILAGTIILALALWPVTKSHLASLQPRTLPVEEIVVDIKPNTAAQPRFLGRDAKDQPYTITADKGVELPGNKIQLDQPKLVTNLNTGGNVTLTAHSGVYDKTERKIQLAGDVTMVHSDGYTLVTPSAWLDQNTNIAWSDQPVQGTGPTGNITAQGFILKENGHRVVFQGDSQLFLITDAK
jgi:lipopolysaccharide export system protein LptC